MLAAFAAALLADDAFAARACARWVDERAGECSFESTSGGRRRAIARLARCSGDERRRRARVAESLGVETRSVTDDVVSVAREAILSVLEDSGSCRSSHPNVAGARVVIVDDARGVVTSVEPATARTLGSCLRVGFGAFEDEARKSLAALQLCRGVAHAHERGLAHGNLTVDSVAVSTLSGGGFGVPYAQISGFYNSPHARDDFLGSESRSRSFEISTESARRLRERSETDTRNITAAWRVGAIGNLEYVMKLNEVVRRGKDREYYAVAPWVIDFSEFPLNSDGSLNGARDLRKTKWRLTKGDEQLDFTYRTTTPPHHVSDDCLSELGVCVALARRTPRSILSRVVRDRFVAQEYPKDLERLYAVTPDEAPLDFYLDPLVFKSIHGDMVDLALPSWCQVGEDSATYFIKIHREAFESRAVSEHLHSWIDVTFGYATYGQAAFEAKNVMMAGDDAMSLASRGRARIFQTPHPKRSFGIVPRAPTQVGAVEMCVRESLTNLELEITTNVAEAPLSVAQDEDLRALGRILGTIYAGAPCPEVESTTPNGLFDESPIKLISGGLFEERDVRTKETLKSFKSWLNKIPREARDVVKLLIDGTKPIAAAAVRDSVLFSQDIRSAATVLGNMRAATESIVARIMAAEIGLKGSSTTVARLILEDLCPEIQEFMANMLLETEEMQLAMSFALFIQTACEVASRKDILEFLLPIIKHAVSTPNAHGLLEGPTLKRELLHLNVLRALRKSVGAATFNDAMIPVLLSGLLTCNAEEVERVVQGLVFIASTAPLPVVLHRIVNVLHKALKNNRDDTSSGAHVLVADALSALSDLVGSHSEAFALKTLDTSTPSVLTRLEDWEHQSPAAHSTSSAWRWLPRSSRFSFDIDEDDEGVLTMSQVLAGAGATSDDLWHLHIDALTSWRVHSNIEQPSAQTLDVSGDEQLFLTHGKTSRGNAVVRLWRTSGPEGEDRRALVNYDGHSKGTITASVFVNFAFDRDGNVSRACSCDDTGYLQVWDTKGAHVWQFFARDSGGFRSICASDARGQHIIGGTSTGSVIVADATAGKVVRRLTCPRNDRVNAIFASSEGLIYASNIEGHMWAFDLRASDSHCVFDVKAHDSGINKIISASNNSHELLTASSDMTVGLWDVRLMNGSSNANKRYEGRLRTFRGHQHEVRDVAVSDKGDVFSVSGTSIGIFSLTSSSERFARFDPLLVHGVTTPSAPKNGSEQSTFRAIRLLPSSRLFALLNDDGMLSVCN